MKRLLIEAISVGILALVVGMATMYLVERLVPSMKEKTLWKNTISLFISGVLIHLICEASGINRWYCDNGNACIKE